MVIIRSNWIQYLSHLSHSGPCYRPKYWSYVSGLISKLTDLYWVSMKYGIGITFILSHFLMHFYWLLHKSVLGTIHILHQHNFGLFLTHPLTMSAKKQYWTSAKLVIFKTHLVLLLWRNIWVDLKSAWTKEDISDANSNTLSLILLMWKSKTFFSATRRTY